MRFNLDLKLLDDWTYDEETNRLTVRMTTQLSSFDDWDNVTVRNGPFDEPTKVGLVKGSKEDGKYEYTFLPKDLDRPAR